MKTSHAQKTQGQFFFLPPPWKNPQGKLQSETASQWCVKKDGPSPPPFSPPNHFTEAEKQKNTKEFETFSPTLNGATDKVRHMIPKDMNL